MDHAVSPEHRSRTERIDRAHSIQRNAAELDSMADLALGKGISPLHSTARIIQNRQVAAAQRLKRGLDLVLLESHRNANLDRAWRTPQLAIERQQGTPDLIFFRAVISEARIKMKHIQNCSKRRLGLRLNYR